MKFFDDTKNSLKNWVGAISKYKCIDYKRKHFKEFDISELNENIIYNENDFENVLESETEEILSCLNEEDRKIFYNHYILGEKVWQMAKKSNKSTGYFFNRLSRGREKIRQNLKEKQI